VRCGALTAPHVAATPVRRHHSHVVVATARRNARAWADDARGSLATRVTQVMASSDNLPGPVKYPRVGKTASQHTPLLLSDVVVLRRVRDGQSITRIARELGVRYSAITNRMHFLRLRFNVHSTWELAHHPIVTPQLEEKP
jgi:DNA-binding NarL/FixJ family response regulator